MKYEVFWVNGRASSVSIVNADGSTSNYPKGSPGWHEFLEWNDKQPADKKLDLSDKAPEPAPVDAEAEEIKGILAKQDRDVSAADLKTLVLKFMRRQAARGL